MYMAGSCILFESPFLTREALAGVLVFFFYYAFLCCLFLCKEQDGRFLTTALGIVFVFCFSL
jgi:DMSO reductase anchor subunit